MIYDLLLWKFVCTHVLVTLHEVSVQQIQQPIFGGSEEPAPQKGHCSLRRGTEGAKRYLWNLFCLATLLTGVSMLSSS